MRKLNLILGLCCVGIGIFLTYGLQYVNVGFNRYLGYMSFLYLIGIINIGYSVKGLRKGKEGKVDE